MSRLGLQRLQISAKLPFQSSLDRARISWNLAEASAQCHLCSLSSARLQGPSGLILRASD